MLQACSPTSDAVCQPCTGACGAGLYRVGQCGPQHTPTCRMCDACSDAHPFVVAPCTDTVNTVCGRSAATSRSTSTVARSAILEPTGTASSADREAGADGSRNAIVIVGVTLVLITFCSLACCCYYRRSWVQHKAPIHSLTNEVHNQAFELDAAHISALSTPKRHLNRGGASRSRLPSSMKKMLTSPHRNAMNKRLNDGVSLLESDVGTDEIAVQHVTPRRNGGGGVHMDRFGFGLPPMMNFNSPSQPHADTALSPEFRADSASPNSKMLSIASRMGMPTAGQAFVRLFSGSVMRRNEETGTDDDLLNISVEHLESIGSSPEGNEYTDVAPAWSVDAVWPVGDSTTDPAASMADENGEAAAQTDLWLTAAGEPKLQIKETPAIIKQTSASSVRKTTGSTTSNHGFEALEALFSVITPIPGRRTSSLPAAALSCAECSKAGAAGSVDTDDDQFYCNSCWATLENNADECADSASEQVAVETGRKTLGNLTNSSSGDFGSNGFWSSDMQPAAMVKPQDQRNTVRAAYLAPMSTAPLLPGFRKVKSFVKVRTTLVSSLPTRHPSSPHLRR